MKLVILRIFIQVPVVRDRLSKSKLVECLLAFGLGGFFIWAGVVKLMDLSGFTQDVSNYELRWEIELAQKSINLFDAPTDAYLAYSLPWLEVFAGLAVVLGVWRSGGAMVILSLLCAFNIALASAWSRGLNINCGCFGQSSEPVNYPLKIGSNVALIIISLTILFIRWRHQRLATGNEENRLAL
jgi:putative oxidoreductase